MTARLMMTMMTDMTITMATVTESPITALDTFATGTGSHDVEGCPEVYAGVTDCTCDCDGGETWQCVLHSRVHPPTQPHSARP